MPTVLRINGYRFFFFSLENEEPPHIHVERETCVAKFWLKPSVLASNYCFRSHELTQLRKLVEKNQDLFWEKWHEHFSN
jgi:hypothetical protein